MHPTHPTIDQALMPQTEVCKAIGQTRSGLHKLQKKDPTFPKPIKFGDKRQAVAYYVIAELNSWLAKKIKDRDVNCASQKKYGVIAPGGKGEHRQVLKTDLRQQPADGGVV